MAPNKIEKQFRTKLQQREIIPSPATWDRLDAMLTVAEEKKAKPNYSWLYIAASIIGFIAIGVVFFSQTQDLVDVKRDAVVITPTPIQSSDSLGKVNQMSLPSTVNKTTVAEVSQENTKELHHPLLLTPNLKTNVIKIQSSIVNRQEVYEGTKQSGNMASSERQRTEEVIINQKTEQLNAAPITATETDIAATEPKLKAEKSIKVNASSLLSEVDGELTFSFREKVIQKIDKNYKTVKVALANRNQKSINN